MIDREEYQNLKKTYTKRCAEAEKQAKIIQSEITLTLENGGENANWMEQFKKHRNIDKLDRAIVVSLIERILVSKDQCVEIIYRWHNEFQWQADLLLQAQEMLPVKEAI